ncbi:hypothetical protein [Chitinophaga sp. HK235]|uniref:hypothetical protein n=1 Tax=Chitinophaga sp. HK235 TaxID=2952571 RepID=UPI001BAD8929|nr:hypothetical protein [Chitinophaga sp. HK235]
MILLNRGEIKSVVVTVSEKAVLSPTVYNIRFRNDLTKLEVTISPAVDISPSPDRYNQFAIDTAIFSDMDNGFHSYWVTDQDGNILEVGKMKLVGEKPVMTQYQDTPTEYKTYSE